MDANGKIFIEKPKYPVWARLFLIIVGSLFLYTMIYLGVCGVREAWYGLHHPRPVVEQAP